MRELIGCDIRVPDCSSGTGQFRSRSAVLSVHIMCSGIPGMGGTKKRPSAGNVECRRRHIPGCLVTLTADAASVKSWRGLRPTPWRNLVKIPQPFHDFQEKGVADSGPCESDISDFVPAGSEARPSPFRSCKCFGNRSPWYSRGTLKTRQFRLTLDFRGCSATKRDFTKLPCTAMGTVPWHYCHLCSLHACARPSHPSCSRYASPGCSDSRTNRRVVDGGSDSRVDGSV